MPQISKIRIVNFNYNDGNRFIPDELYDLASPDTGKALNTLFNLNNGGGKTVLVVTIKEMYGINRIDEFIKNCNLNGWLVNAIDIQNRIEIHEKINEEIRFD